MQAAPCISAVRARPASVVDAAVGVSVAALSPSGAKGRWAFSPLPTLPGPGGRGEAGETGDPQPPAVPGEPKPCNLTLGPCVFCRPPCLSAELSVLATHLPPCLRPVTKRVLSCQTPVPHGLRPSSLESPSPLRDLSYAARLCHLHADRLPPAWFPWDRCLAEHGFPNNLSTPFCPPATPPRKTGMTMPPVHADRP